MRWSEEKFSSLYHSKSEGVAFHELIYNEWGEAIDYIFLDVNPVYEAITGLKRETALGRRASELYGTEKAPYLEIYAKVAASGEPTSYETYLPAKEKYFNVSVFSPCRGEFATIFTDITERKRAEDDLYELSRVLKVLSACNQVLLRATEESELLNEICRIIVEVGGYRLAWIGFAEQDEEKTVRTVAQAGYEQGYLETLNITWADTEQGRGPIGKAIRRGKPSIEKNIPTDSKVIPCRFNATQRDYASSIALPLIAYGKIFGVLNIYAVEPDAFNTEEVELLTELANDISYGIFSLRDRAERKRAENTLRELQQEYERLVDTIDGIVWEADAQTLQFSFVSKRAERLLGYSVQSWLREPAFWKEHLHPDDRERVIAFLKKAAAEKKTQEVEFRMLADNGRPVWLRNTLAVFAEDSKPLRLYGVMVDITERKRSEKIKKACEQIENNIEQFAILINGIRNPLEVIAGLKGDETSKKIVQQVKRSEEILEPFDKDKLSPRRLEFFRESIEDGGL